MTEKTDFDGTRPSELNSASSSHEMQRDLSGRGARNVDRALLWTALVCGGIPLVIGSAIYFSFRMTRNEALAVAGLYTVLGGLAFFAVGIMCLVAYVHRRRDFDAKTLLLGALLFSNFPAAGIYALSAIGMMTQYVVQVVNESEAIIDSFVVEGPGVQVELGPIQARESKQCRVFFNADGALTFKARQQQLRFDGEIEGYVTTNLGGMATIHIQPGRKFTVLRTD